MNVSKILYEEGTYELNAKHFSDFFSLEFKFLSYPVIDQTFNLHIAKYANTLFTPLAVMEIFLRSLSVKTFRT